MTLSIDKQHKLFHEYECFEHEYINNNSEIIYRVLYNTEKSSIDELNKLKKPDME